jgi:hypothetical protein
MKLLPSYLRPGRSAERSLAGSPAGSDSLGRGMDVALTLGAFLGIGWLIDAWLGVFPAFTIGLVVFAAVGTFIRLKYTYDRTMERLEAERLAARAARTAPVPDGPAAPPAARQLDIGGAT